jgi:hypothetical protein
VTHLIEEPNESELRTDAPQWALEIEANGYEHHVFGIVTTTDGRRLLGSWTVYQDWAHSEQYGIRFDKISDFTPVVITDPDGNVVDSNTVRIAS